LTAPVDLHDLTDADLTIDVGSLGRVKRISETAPRFEKQKTLAALVPGAQSFWTYAVRESGHLHVEKMVEPTTVVDDLPRVFPHTIPCIFAAPFHASAVCTHQFFDALQGNVRFVSLEPVPEPPVSVRGRIDVVQGLFSTACDVVQECGDRRVQDVSDDQVVAAGETYIWFDSSQQHPREFFHFLRHKVTVHLHSCDFRKGWPTLGVLDVADDTSYTQLQRLVAEKIGCEKPSHLRFSKFNPETGCPRPQRLPAKDATDVKSILTMPSGLLSDRIYVDVCEVPAVEADESNYIRFELFSDSVRYVSTHGVVLPPAGKFNVGDLIAACRNAAGIEEDRAMRFVDVWKGRFYAVYSDHAAPFTEQFQALADYRLEFVPEKIEGISDDLQMLINVNHMTRTATGFTPHSDPFTISIAKTDLASDVKRRIAHKLKLPVETVSAWKPAITLNKEIIEVTEDTPLCDQLQKVHEDPAKVVFALEHTPLPGTRANTNWRREEGVKIRT